MRKLRVIALAAVLGGAMSLALPATAFASTSGTEHFEIVYTSQNGPGPVIATGVFSAGGTEYQGRNIDEAVFPDGGFSIDHRGGQVTFSFNPKTCVGKLTGNGLPYTIFRGFGAYTGIHGSGTATLRGSFVTGRNPNGTCNHTTVTAITVIHASGPVSL
jgi:hypothetical protein